MAIPKTFSAPADETFPHLDGYVPSPEDSLRYAVWLMLMADDVNRRAYSNVPDDPDAGVRITQGRPHYDPQTMAMTLPCQIVRNVVADGNFTFATSNQGELEIVIGIAHIEAVDTSAIDTDVDEPTKTAETALHRIRQILMRGTLYRDGDVTRQGKVIDPYLTPRNEDGTYAAPFVNLALQPPRIVAVRENRFPNKLVKSFAELEATPLRDFAVSYGWLARYTVVVHDRDLMR